MTPIAIEGGVKGDRQGVHEAPAAGRPPRRALGAVRLERHRQDFPARAASALRCHSSASSTAACQAIGSAKKANDFCRHSRASVLVASG